MSESLIRGLMPGVGVLAIGLVGLGLSAWPPRQGTHAPKWMTSVNVGLWRFGGGASVVIGLGLVARTLLIAR